MYASLYLSCLIHTGTNTPCSSTLSAYSGLSLVNALVEVQKNLVCGEEFWLHLSVMTGCVVFRPVVHQVVLTRSPEEAELVFMGTAVMKPVEVHVNCFGLFVLNTTVDDIFGSAIVSLDGCGGLRMSQLWKYVTYINSFASIDV